MLAAIRLATETEH